MKVENGLRRSKKIKRRRKKGTVGMTDGKCSTKEFIVQQNVKNIKKEKERNQETDKKVKIIT